MTKRTIPTLASRGQFLTLLLVGISSIALMTHLRRAGTDPENLLGFLSQFVFPTFLPFVVLVVTTSSLGSLVEQKTLVYFWLRPIARWKISAAALLASLVVLVPTVLIPIGVLGAIADKSALGGVLVGTAVGLLAYGSLFTMLGLFTQKALLWGSLYILIWEGIVPPLSRPAGWLAVRTYANGAFQHLTDARLGDNPPTGMTISLVTAAIVIVSVGVSTWRLNTMTIE